MPKVYVIDKWRQFIGPALSEHLFCGLSSISRSTDVLKAILKCKPINVNAIDYKMLHEKWPFLTKTNIQLILSNQIQSKEKDMALYKKIEMHLKSPGYGIRNGGKIQKNIFQRKLRLVNAFDELREEQMKENNT